jgi:hypothetical protein
VHAHKCQVQLNPGHEHQVQQSELPEFGNRGITGSDQVQPEGADRKAADDQADDPWNPRASNDWRAEDDHQEQNQELPGGSGG